MNYTIFKFNFFYIFWVFLWNFFSIFLNIFDYFFNYFNFFLDFLSFLNTVIFKLLLPRRDVPFKKNVVFTSSLKEMFFLPLKIEIYYKKYWFSSSCAFFFLSFRKNWNIFFIYCVSVYVYVLSCHFCHLFIWLHRENNKKKTVSFIILNV